MGQLLVTVKRWRTWILTILVVAILMATLPGAIRRILQTGDLYLFTRQFFDDMLARLLGSGRFRFVLQPIVVVLLGLCDGLKDARKGGPSFLWALAFHAEHRRELLRGTFVSIREVVAVAIFVGHSFAIPDFSRNSCWGSTHSGTCADRRATRWPVRSPAAS